MGLRSSFPISRDSLKSGSHKLEFDCIWNMMCCASTSTAAAVSVITLEVDLGSALFV